MIYPKCFILFQIDANTYKDKLNLYLMENNYHKLNLSYEEYVRMGRSIANCQLEHYYIYENIGKGAYGYIYIGMDDRTKKIVAFKLLDLTLINQQRSPKVREIRLRLAKTEPLLMMICNSENIIKCYDVYQNQCLEIMVIEYCNGFTLQKEIQQKKRIPENQAILIMRQLVNGISEMHRYRIIHRDLKAENIISHNGVYKIADLGFSKQMKCVEEQVRQTTLGTITTMAPEVLEKAPYGVKADIWSIGIIFFQMIFGEVPYNSKSANKMKDQIEKKKILNTERFTYNNYTASKEVTSFLRDVLVVDPKSRLDWAGLQKHPLFDSEKLEPQFLIKSVWKSEKNEGEQDYDSEQLQGELMRKSAGFQLQDELRIRPLSRSEFEMRKDEVIRASDAQRSLHRWVQQCHLQCLKTQLIYYELVEKIIQNELFDLTDRDVIQMLFLMLTRGLNNMSILNVKLKQSCDYIVQNLKDTVTKLYNKVASCWNEYSDKLTDTENKVSSIIFDGLCKIFSNESFRQRDRFLTGIENIQYSKKEQIEFTFSYIRMLVDRMGESKGTNLNYIRKLMINYMKINAITLDQLQASKLTFYDYIEAKIFE